ncbi:MAG: LepB protein [candidate division TM6 bacterium GW2011_GWE2_42_60]|nr:MAG: LepB protein [candidate division TM6 bacterium GW2011_GWE2_42_60]HBY05998.1 signal peptidase I [Candidatus Dependentiae bacterium]
MLKRASAWLDRQMLVVQLAVLVFIVFLIRTFLFGLYLVPTGSMETTMLVGERFFADKLTPYITSLKHGEIIAFDAPKYAYSSNSIKRTWQKYVWGPDNWTKRVIGLPGEHLQGTIENGKPVIYRDGKKLDEPYLNKYPLIALWKRDTPDSFAMRSWTWKSFDPNVPFDKQEQYKIDKDTVIQEGGGPNLLWPATPLKTDIFDVHLGPDEYWVMGDNRLGSDDSRSWGPLKGEFIHGRILFRILSVDSQEGWLLWDMIRHPIAFWSKVRWNRCFSVVR